MSNIAAMNQTSSFSQKCTQLSAVFACIACLMLPVSISGTDIACILSFVTLLASGQFKKKIQFLSQQPLVWLSLSVYAVVIVGCLWGQVPWHYRGIVLHKYIKLLYIPFLLLIFRQEKWQKHSINAFILGISINVVASYAKAAGLLPHWHRAATEMFIFHIYASYITAFAIYLVGHRLLFTKTNRLLHASLLTLFIGYEFFINISRAGYLITLLLFAMLMFQKYDWKKALTIFVVSSAGFIFILHHFSHTFNNKIQQTSTSFNEYSHVTKDTSWGFRLQFAKFSAGLIKERPLLGHGTGSFKYLFDKIGHNTIPGWTGSLNTPHNDYLLFAVQFGLIGLAILLYFFYRAFMLTIKLDTQRKQIGQALVVSFMISCCCNAMLYTTVVGHFFILMACVLLVHSKNEEKYD